MIHRECTDGSKKKVYHYVGISNGSGVKVSVNKKVRIDNGSKGMIGGSNTIFKDYFKLKNKEGMFLNSSVETFTQPNENGQKFPLLTSFTYTAHEKDGSSFTTSEQEFYNKDKNNNKISLRWYFNFSPLKFDVEHKKYKSIWRDNEGDITQFEYIQEGGKEYLRNIHSNETFEVIYGYPKSI